MQSIFTRPRARPPLAAVSSQQNMLAVSTEDELLAALTSLPRSDGACYGRGINIVGDITLTQPIKLRQQHSGLVITSSSNARLSTKTALTQAFDCALCVNLIIERLSVDAGFSVTSFVQFALSSECTVRGILVGVSASLTNLVTHISGSSLCVDGCMVSSGGPAVVLIVGAINGFMDRGIVSNNINFSGGIATLNLRNSAVYGNIALGGWTNGNQQTKDVMVTGNRFSGAITLIGSAAGSGNISIVGNSMGNSNINTSATAGSNSIVGNVNVGTITNAATDAVTSNT